jgi:GTP cyclohydrolase I
MKLDLPLHSAETMQHLEALAVELLVTLGEDPHRPGLRDTPRRWARWWVDFLGYTDERQVTTFESNGADQMVVVSGIRVWSLCEHHLLPFWCDLTLGYLPAGKVLGLSKFGRIAHFEAHGLTTQESLVQRIADRLVTVCETPNVAVVGSGEHLCMTMRGARSPHRMRTSVMLGRFREAAPVREEFFHLAGAVG